MPACTRREVIGTFASLALCLALTIALLGLYYWTGNSNALLFAILGPVICATPFYLRIKRIFASRHFTRSELLLSTHRPALGDSLRVRVTLVPAKAIALDSVNLMLRSVETTRISRRDVKSVEVVSCELALSVPGPLEAGVERVFDTELPVPSQGMESFEGRRASLRWEFVASAILHGVPIPIDRQEIMVQPVRVGVAFSPLAEVSAGSTLRLTARPARLQAGSHARLEVTLDPALSQPGATVDVSLFWRATVHDIEELEERSVFSRSLSAPAPGETIALDILLPPAGPISYEGKLFSISWNASASLKSPSGLVTATTDLPLMLDPQNA